MGTKERRELATRLVEETRRIGETLRDIDPSIVSLIWTPDGYTSVTISGKESNTILDAFSFDEDGRVTVL
jgi:hypothetical protein